MSSSPDNPLRLALIEAEAEILRRHYEDSDKNPIFAWAAIRLFMRGRNRSYPLPGWLSQFLGNVAYNVMELAEGIDRSKMPDLPRSDASKAEVDEYLLGLAKWEKTRSLDMSKAREKLLKVLRLSGTDKHVFWEFERRVRLQIQAEQFANELHHACAVDSFEHPDDPNPWRCPETPRAKKIRSRLITEWARRPPARERSNLLKELREGEDLLVLGRLKVKAFGPLDAIQQVTSHPTRYL